jgi:hypothetical protein
VRDGSLLFIVQSGTSAAAGYTAGHGSALHRVC